MQRLTVLDALSDARRGRLLDAFGRLAAIDPSVRVLDLGGGTGVAAARFAARAREVVILDADPERTRHGAARRCRLSFVVALAERIPFAPDCFERVVSLNSFHHLADRDSALREARRVLAVGGVLFLADIDARSLRGRWLGFFERRVMGHRVHFLTPDEARRAAESAGWVDVETGRLGGGFFVRARKGGATPGLAGPRASPQGITEGRLGTEPEIAAPRTAR